MTTAPDKIEILPITLTPVQLRGLKLALEGDLYPQEGNKWTHLNATITYAKTDRFKERARKIRFATTTTVNQLRDFGLLNELGSDDAADQLHQEITMAGKIWLLKNK
ncbi:hypothetical protein [Rhizobium sp. CECT 9324]|uniref:hypothetical protein n=1 Tax=Rhizobium sp. CECT 9324 TaxID=2845820 RepID=UPI000DE0A18E|nr:hypothetical protein [Rhizobium sp. CECT 9324]CAH0343399.1 hypothetical protein RHI9324_05133 [Rhizobium sp. CECT 9324]